MASRAKVKFINKEEWMGNSPDLAPMDFAVNGIFKKMLKKRVLKNPKQLIRVIRAEWKKFPISIIRRALMSWKKRVSLMVERLGFQFEHEL